MTERRVAGLYGVAFVPVGGLALALGGLVMDLSKHSIPGLPSGADGWALNIVPSFAVGLIAYLALARFVGARSTGGHRFRGHTRRCAALYLLTLGLGVILLHDGSSPDFWSLGQLVLWLWIVALAGIVGDGLAVLRR